MFRKIQHRVFRDPIHGYINIYDQVIWDAINSKEFQRLRRIKQLGASHQVYQTAEHSRFSHSLGVYEITRRLFNEVKGLNNLVTQYDQTVTLLAALLHDLGHGPFSHSFESVSRINHEKYTEMIILGDTEINHILKQIDEQLPHQV
ncbi:MAG: HD domain-containing protein, partial [Erysipelothrix sp.]|nr:HD domain-containing protein [Erysipelothrix sp.]